MNKKNSEGKFIMKKIKSIKYELSNLNDVVDFVGEENVGYNTVSEELWIKSFGNWALVPGGYYIIAGLPGEYYIVNPYNFEKGM